MKYFFTTLLSVGMISATLCVTPLSAIAAEEHDDLESLLSLSIEELLDLKITTASKFSETRLEAPGIVSVVTKKEIEAFGANNLVEILNRVTSIHMKGGSGLPQNFISIRGDQAPFFNQRVLLLINGRPFRDTTFGGLDSVLLLGFPIKMIDRIEIIRGPGSVLYGSNAVNGVISVITKAGESREEAAVTVGSFSTSAIELSGGGTVGGLQFSGGLLGFKEGGWDFESFDESGASVSTDYGEENLSVFTQLEYKNIALNIFIGQNRQDEFGTVPFLPIVERKQNRYFIDFGLAKALTGSWDLNFNLTYNRLDHEVPLHGTLPTPMIETLSESSLVEISAKYLPTQTFHLIVGAVADFHRGFISPDLPVKVARYREWWYQGYAEASFWPTAALKLIGGLQWNAVEGLDGKLVPRIGTIFKVNEAWNFKLLYGEAYRSSYPLERLIDAGTILTGNPNLKPETVQTTEAQLLYHRPHLETAVTLFHVTQEDLIVRVGGGPITFANKDKVTFNGIELELMVPFEDRLFLTGSFSYQENEDRAGLKNVTLIPNTLWKLGASYHLTEAVTASLFNVHVSAATDNLLLNPTRKKLNGESKAYNALSLNVVVDLNRLLHRPAGTRTILSIYGTNLLDEEINTPEFARKNINTLPLTAGRAVYGKIDIHFN